jgi:hypothetical protein
MWMLWSQDRNLRKLAHDSKKYVVFSLIGPTQCCLFLRSYSLLAYLFPKTYPMMTDKSQIKWSAGLRKRDLADDEDQRADLRVYPSLPYLTSTSLRAAAEIFV